MLFLPSCPPSYEWKPSPGHCTIRTPGPEPYGALGDKHWSDHLEDQPNLCQWCSVTLEYVWQPASIATAFVIFILELVRDADPTPTACGVVRHERMLHLTVTCSSEQGMPYRQDAPCVLHLR